MDSRVFSQRHHRKLTSVFHGTSLPKMSEPPSSPLQSEENETFSEQSQDYQQTTDSPSNATDSPLSSPRQPSSQSSPDHEPPPKKKRTWQVKSTLGQPSRSTRSLWRRQLHDDPDNDVLSDQSTESMHSRSPVSGCNAGEANVHSPVSTADIDSSISEISTSVSDKSEYTSSDKHSASDQEERLASESPNTSSDHDCDISSAKSEDCQSDPQSDNDSLGETDFMAVYEGSTKGVDEAVYDILNDNFQNKETQASLKAHLKTFLKYLPTPNKMPKTVKQLLKYVESFTDHIIVRENFYCSQCFLSSEGDECQGCGSTVKKIFYTFSLESQIRHFLENCDLASEIEKSKQDKNSSDPSDVICDICDGCEYKTLTLGTFDITLLWYADGVSVSRSSKMELWPLQFIICELPPHLRSKYLGVCGLWCDTVKPPMNTFLQPFVKEIEEINLKGGLSWKHAIKKETHTSKVYAPVACGDAPARADFQNIQRHNSKFPCNTCEQETVQIPLSHEEEAAQNAGKRVRRRRALVYTEVQARLRSGKRMKRQADKAFHSNSPVKGVKGRTCVQSIPGLDIGKFVYAEYMHGVCLGVVKTFITLWLCVPGLWSLKAHCDSIDNFVKCVKPTSDVNRILKCLSEFIHWKASEFRQWLLFVSLPAVSQYLPPVYLQHWMLLVLAMSILLQEEISMSDLERAEIMLKLFVRDIAVLYRLQDYVYNVHQLLHLPLYVKRWGPLRATSAFSFEGFNGNLVDMLHGTKNPAKELSDTLRRTYGMQNLRNRLSKHLSASDGSSSDPETLNRLPINVLSDQDKCVLASLGLKLGDSKFFSRVRIGRQTFTSILYTREKERNNYTVSFRKTAGICYGEIKFFVSLNDGNNVLAYIEVFQVEHTRFYRHVETRSIVTHIIPFVDTCERVVIPINDIVSKVFRVGSYVYKLPNRYEKNL